MTTQILNYHETTEAGSSGPLHALTHEEFDRHLDLIQSSGIPVAPAVDLFPEQLASGRRLAITVDDGLSSDFLNAQKLVKRGMSGTFFVCSAYVGQPGYLDASQLREMADMGMVIGSHSHEHIRLTTQSLVNAQADVRRSKEILESILARPVDRFAFPGGAHTKVILKVVREAGFPYVFGTGWGQSDCISVPGQVALRRNNMIRGMSDDEVLSLITLRNHWRRHVLFNAKEVLSKALPDSLYNGLRGLLMPR